MYIEKESHMKHQLNQTPNFDYLGHPVNAYHFLRHIASGWNNILEKTSQTGNEKDLLDYYGKSKI